MKFEAGKYYQHESGRRIRVSAEEVNTLVWKRSYVVESYDKTGYEVSILGIDNMPEVGPEWVEIGEGEYIDNFIYVPCEGCGLYIQKGQNYIVADEGIYHAGPQPSVPNCYKSVEEGPTEIVGAADV